MENKKNNDKAPLEEGSNQESLGNPAPQGSSVGSSSEISDLKKQLEKLQSDILYQKADFENYKKRTLKERSDIIKYGSEGLILSILDLLDNFERALAHDISEENFYSFLDGMKMISKEFLSSLEKFGVTEIPALGEKFDPNVYEALGVEPSEEYAPGTISQVLLKPYRLHDRVIRHGKVVIVDNNKTTNPNG